MDIYYRKLEIIEDCYNKLKEIRRDNPDIKTYKLSWKDKDSAERNLQKIIEAIIDIGKIIISEKGLREPGNNREVFLILNENGLFPSEYMPLIDKMIGMRNVIVHSYDRIDDTIVFGIIKKNLSNIKKLQEFFKKICISKISINEFRKGRTSRNN